VITWLCFLLSEYRPERIGSAVYLIAARRGGIPPLNCDEAVKLNEIKKAALLVWTGLLRPSSNSRGGRAQPQPVHPNQYLPEMVCRLAYTICRAS
jgi:hypothetical protein